MRTATAGVILAAEATLGWSVGLRGDAFFAFAVLWVIVLLLCELRAVGHHRARPADRPERDPAGTRDSARDIARDIAEDRRSELV